MPDSFVSLVINFAQSDTGRLKLVVAEFRRRQEMKEVTAQKERLATILDRAKDYRFTSGGRCTRGTPTRVRRLIAEHRQWSDEELLSVACGGIVIGMSAEQVVASWGRPNDINRSIYSSGVHEQWVYGELDASYVYLEDGVVTSLQN